MVTMNIGKIVISDELLLRYFDFYPEGQIVNIYKSERHGMTEIVISHPDMPSIEERDMVPIVSPIYIEQCDSLGRKIIFREKADGK